MRRITMWLVATVCGLVLLFSYRTSTMGASGGPATVAHAPGTAGGNAPGIVSGAAPPATTTPPPAAPSPGPAIPSPAPASPSPSRKTGQDLVVNGSVAQTRWGPVQVQVRISGGKIVDVSTLEVPDGNRRDLEINSYAVPVLRNEVLAAQNAQIDTVGGATVTSDGYIQSLQAALDAAHFA